MRGAAAPVAEGGRVWIRPWPRRVGAMADAGPLMQSYEGSARGRGVETAGWRLCLAHRFSEQRQPYGAGDVPFRDVLRHVGLALRYGQGHRRRAGGGGAPGTGWGGWGA